MTREGAIALIVLFTVAIFALLGWAWWRRTRRDAGIAAPIGEAPAGAAVVGSHPVLYVATTRHDEPLERLAIRGLGFRSRADLVVTDAGIALDLTGQPRIFLDASRIDSADRATVAIDRVVEKDGLARVSWRTDDGTVVDSYFRPQEVTARVLSDAVAGVIPEPQTGADA